MGISMRDRNSIRHMFGDSSDVDLALAGGQPLRVASVKQFFRCITLLHRGVGDMREGQTQTGRSRDLIDRATEAIEMQRVHENANAGPAAFTTLIAASRFGTTVHGKVPARPKVRIGQRGRR
jgi:hypothetical protein